MSSSECALHCRAWSVVMQQRRAQTFTGDIIIYDAIIFRQSAIYCCQNLSWTIAGPPHSLMHNPVNQERALPSSAEMAGLRAYQQKGMLINIQI